MYPTIGSALTMRSPSITIRSRRTPWVAGCCGPMLSTMSAVARLPAPTPTVSSRGGVGEVMGASLPVRGTAGSAGGIVVGAGDPAPVVQPEQDDALAAVEGGQLLQGHRPGLHRLVDRDAVVVGERRLRRDGDPERRPGVLVLVRRVRVDPDRHPGRSNLAVGRAGQGPP